jgi:galactitol-specific phosphotransferase system IIC component
VSFDTTREISAFADGGNPVRFWLFHLFQGNIWAILATLGVLGMIWIAFRHSTARMAEARTLREPVGEE